eukprot:1188961-Prorocentrum_minimum.AAC.1
MKTHTHARTHARTPRARAPQLVSRSYGTVCKDTCAPASQQDVGSACCTFSGETPLDRAINLLQRSDSWSSVSDDEEMEKLLRAGGGHTRAGTRHRQPAAHGLKIALRNCVWVAEDNSLLKPNSSNVNVLRISG